MIEMKINIGELIFVLFLSFLMGMIVQMLICYVFW